MYASGQQERNRWQKSLHGRGVNYWKILRTFHTHKKSQIPNNTNTFDKRRYFSSVFYFFSIFCKFFFYLLGVLLSAPCRYKQMPCFHRLGCQCYWSAPSAVSWLLLTIFMSNTWLEAGKFTGFVVLSSVFEIFSSLSSVASYSTSGLKIPKFELADDDGREHICCEVWLFRTKI